MAVLRRGILGSWWRAPVMQDAQAKYRKSLLPASVLRLLVSDNEIESLCSFRHSDGLVHIQPDRDHFRPIAALPVFQLVRASDAVLALGFGVFRLGYVSVPALLTRYPFACR